MSIFRYHHQYLIVTRENKKTVTQTVRVIKAVWRMISNIFTVIDYRINLGEN